MSGLTPQQQYAIFRGALQSQNYNDPSTAAGQLYAKLYQTYSPNDPKPSSGESPTFAKWMMQNSDQGLGSATYNQATGVLRNADGSYQYVDPALFTDPSALAGMQQAEVANTGMTWDQYRQNLFSRLGLKG